MEASHRAVFEAFPGEFALLAVDLHQGFGRVGPGVAAARPPLGQCTAGCTRTARSAGSMDSFVGPGNDDLIFFASCSTFALTCADGSTCRW